MKTSGHGSYRLLVRLMVFAVLLFSMTFWQQHSAPSAAAASDGVSSWMDCGINGHSTIYWNGYFPLSEGSTDGYLTQEDPSTGEFFNRAYGHNSARGVDGSAPVDLGYPYTPGNWIQKGFFTGTWFSGTRLDWSPTTGC